MAETPSDSDLILTHKRCSPTSFKHLLRIQVTVELDEFRNQPRPARLMAGSKTRSVVSVEVLIEQQVVPPVEIVLKLLCAPVHRPSASLVAEEYALQTVRDLLGHLKQIHSVP